MNDKQKGGAVVVAIGLVIGLGWWWYDSQKPEHKIQGTWGGMVDGVPLGLNFENGQLAMVTGGPGSEVAVSGSYKFISDSTMVVAFDAGSAGAPIPAGRLTVTAVSDQALTLLDDAGTVVRLTRY